MIKIKKPWVNLRKIKKPVYERRDPLVGLKFECLSERNIAEIACHYGFRPILKPEILRSDISKAKQIFDISKIKKDANEVLSISLEDKIALMRVFDEQNMRSWPQPTMLFYGANQEDHKEEQKRYISYYLDIIGTYKSIAEAMIIQTSCQILMASGFNDLIVKINSIGDKDSIHRFSKEMVAYYRSNLNNLHNVCKQIFRKDPFELIDCKHEKCQTVAKNIPDPVNFLSEESAQHFEEVLEYLEAINIRYKMSRCLILNKKFHSQTVFEIRDLTTDQKLALGVRYNEVPKKLGFKREPGAVGAIISMPKKNPTKALKKIIIKRSPPPVYFIQLGFSAKLKSFEILEMLRREKIGVMQTLGNDQIIGQLQYAEDLGIPYAIIMGQKEAIEKTVILRNIKEQSQSTIGIDELPKYLRKISKKS